MFRLGDFSLIIIVFIEGSLRAASDQPSMIWMDAVTCKGTELSLDLCPFNGWGNVACVHQEDAAVCCSIYQNSTFTETVATFMTSSNATYSEYSAQTQSIRLFERSDLPRPLNTSCGRVEVHIQILLLARIPKLTILHADPTQRRLGDSL